jgi:hypothetical protein
LSQYLNHLIKPDDVQWYKFSEKLPKALEYFKKRVKWEKVLAKIEKIVMQNILRPRQSRNMVSITEACQKLKQATNIYEADNYLTLDYKMIQNIVG